MMLSLKPSLQEAAERRRIARMQNIDALPEDWRALVHEYGYCVVDALMGCGVKKAKQARHIVETVLDELSPIRGSSSNQGTGALVSKKLVLIPLEPTEGMIAASMATVVSFDTVVSKREKHRLRLKAALSAATAKRRAP